MSTQILGLKPRMLLRATGLLLSATAFAGVANAADDPQSASPSAADSKSGSAPSLQEIVVTAEKRSERLIDTPLSVSVVSSDSLEKNGAVQFSDWATSVPGLTFTTQGAGFSQISLRGVTVGNDLGTTVATYVDDVPFGGSTIGVGSDNFTFDPGLFDVDRIEVLRGPQGTLYGASSLGGLIKYVSPVPDTEKFSGKAQTGISATENGGTSYNGSAGLNLPLIAGIAAVRVSGFYSHDGGFIDNITLGQKNVNQSDVKGGRIDLLLTLVEGLSIRVDYFLQDIDRDGQVTANYSVNGSVPLAGNYDQERSVTEPFTQRFRLASATIKYDFHPAEFTSITSYQTEKDNTNWNAPLYAGYCAYVGAVCAAAEVPSSNDLKKFTQEVRLTSHPGTLEWAIGGFYTHESDAPFVGITGLNAASQPVSLLLSENLPSLYVERAVFGDLTYHVTDKIELTGGVRYFSDHQTEGQDPSIGPFGAVILPRASDEHAFTYLANASYHLTPDNLAYVRFATGYRPGGPTVFSSIGPPPAGTPNSYAPDRLQSYEIGYKGELLDRKLTLDISEYHINWFDIHGSGVINGFSIIVNSGNAIINGTEVSIAAHPTRDLTISGSLTYEHAYLSTANPDLGGTIGERLPTVPRINAQLSADYNIPVSELRPTIGLSAGRVTSRDATFGDIAGGTQYYLPGYTKVDLRAGIRVGDVKVGLYIHNLTNALIQQSANRSLTTGGVTEVAIGQPRTYGMNAIYKF